MFPKYVDVTIEKVTRLSDTARGNPRWTLSTDRGLFRSEHDSAVALAGDWGLLQGRRIRLWLRARNGKVMDLSALRPVTRVTQPSG